MCYYEMRGDNMGRKKKDFVIHSGIEIIDGVPYNVFISRDPNGNITQKLSRNVAGQYDIKEKYKRNSLEGAVEGYKLALDRLFEGVKNQGDLSRLIQQSVHYTQKVREFLAKEKPDSSDEDYKELLLSAICESIQAFKDKYSQLSNEELSKIINSATNDELMLKNSITYHIIKDNIALDNEEEDERE